MPLSTAFTDCPYKIDISFDSQISLIAFRLVTLHFAAKNCVPNMLRFIQKWY